MANIDLKELSARESERVEWKKNVADIDQVIKTIVAFANDISNLGGGYVVCGAEEGTDEHGFQKVFYTGLMSSRLKELEGKVLNHCREKVSPPVVPITEEIQVDEDRRILVFIIAATGNAHSYRAGGKDSSTYYIRIGRDTIEARNSLLTEVLIKKNQLEPWDRRINKNAGIDAFDLIVLREYLQEMGLWSPKKTVEELITDKATLSSFIPPFTGKVDLIDELHPRNFALLMFGKDPLKFIPGAYTIFSIYRGKDRSEPTAERYELTGPIVQQAKRSIELLNTEAYTAFDKTTDVPNQVKYPIRALQEAVVNAIVHRDYESNQPSRITVFVDRIEINSPGALPRAIDKGKFVEGKASPFWRNQSLAYFFNKLQLAQAEGQGIPTILKLMKENGCPNPIFEFEPESVICTLPAHPRHQLMRELTEIENKIVIGNKTEALEKLEAILEKDPYNFRALDLFCEVNNLLGTPLRIYNFLDRKKLNLNNINPATLINIAESLAAAKRKPEFLKLADELLSFAISGQLEEKEIITIAINLRKIGNNEKAVEFLNDVIASHSNLKSNSTLRQQRARAKMDLAKKCMDTGRDTAKYINRIRARAWEQCREYLDEAEIDLNSALENVTNPIEKDYVLQDMEFLKKLKNASRKPLKKKSRYT